MKITALVENTTARGLRTVHGLSLYIETATHRLLFDVGPDDTLFAKMDGVVRFERLGKTRKQVSIYPKAEVAAQ